jgi:hypothetical protein
MGGVPMAVYKGQCTGGSGRVSQGAVYTWQSRPIGSVQVAVSAKGQCTGGSVQVAMSAKVHRW